MPLYFLLFDAVLFPLRNYIINSKGAGYLLTECYRIAYTYYIVHILAINEIANRNFLLAQENEKDIYQETTQDSLLRTAGIITSSVSGSPVRPEH